MSGQGNLAADGSGAQVEVAGETLLHANGTFGGGTLTFELLAPNGTWLALDAFTANGFAIRNLRGEVRATLSGATTPNLNWAII